MLTVQQVADRLQLSIKTVRRMAARGDFPGAHKLGGEGRGRREWRIPCTAIHPPTTTGEQQ